MALDFTFSQLPVFSHLATCPFCHFCHFFAPQLCAQQLLGGITRTVINAAGAAVPDVAVTVKNLGTNLEIKTSTQGDGGGYQERRVYQIGAYSVTFTKDGFKTEAHTAISVKANRTSTVDGKLEVGGVSTSAGGDRPPPC